MRLLSTLPARIVRSGAPALLALATLGAETAAVAAPARPGPAPATSKFTWHAFKLLNGWESASAPKFKTGTPSWTLRNGVIYLRGAVKVQTDMNDATFSTLPSYARPAHNLYIQVDTTSETPGTVRIGTDGTVEAYNGHAKLFASLAGISYPIAPIKSHKLTLQHGWVSSQGQYDTGDPAYAISGGIVYLSGSLKLGATAQVAFTLPKAARPPHLTFMSVYTFDGSTGSITIRPNGQVLINGADASSYTSLANISFPVTGTKWTNFKLEDGWKSGFTAFHTASPAYAIINGVVYLTGTMLGQKAPNGLWTELPKGVKTAVDVLELEVYTSGPNGAIAVTNSGGVVASSPFSYAQGCTSLGGIAYPQSS
jgi:hypothetical protein